MIYNCLALAHTLTASDITSDSKITSLSNQSKLHEIKKNIDLKSGNLANPFCLPFKYV